MFHRTDTYAFTYRSVSNLFSIIYYLSLSCDKSLWIFPACESARQNRNIGCTSAREVESRMRISLRPLSRTVISTVKYLKCKNKKGSLRIKSLKYLLQSTYFDFSKLAWYNRWPTFRATKILTQDIQQWYCSSFSTGYNYNIIIQRCHN